MSKGKLLGVLVLSLAFGFVLAGCGAAGSSGQGGSQSGDTVRIRMVGPSMEPTYSDGDIILMAPVSAGDLRRGDVVDFAGPDGQMYVKRVIGLPGETVEIHDGGVYINGSLLNEAYSCKPPDYTMEAVTAGSGQFFILGDNRPLSADSHAFGPVSGANVKYRLAGS